MDDINSEFARTDMALVPSAVGALRLHSCRGTAQASASEESPRLSECPFPV